MDMDTILMEMKENEYKGMKKLLAQYQAELNDLRSGNGIAKTMFKEERWEAEKSLEQHIELLVQSILDFEKMYSYVL